jgi:hypothetical protein
VTARTDVYYNFFNPSFLFFSGDASLINATREAGVLLLSLAVLVPLGMYYILTARSTRINLMLLLCFFCAPLAAVLVAEVKINRALVMLPFAALIATFGVAQLWDARNRMWRLVAVTLLLFVPVQFRSFYLDYLHDYRLRSAYWFENNIRGATEQLMARAPAGGNSRIYLSTDIQWIEWYWPLYLIKEGREDLRPRSAYFDPKTLDVRAVPSGSLVLSRSDAASEQPFSDIGPLRNLTPIPEPTGGVYFAVFER